MIHNFAFTALKNEDFSVLQKRGYRYADTWDAELVFVFIEAVHVVYAVLSLSMPDFRKHLHRERDMCISGGRLILACRSHNLSCIFRGPAHDTSLRCVMGRG
jgi:hypothetical protein